MTNSTHQKVHLIGIGGIGISALARLYVHQGVSVSGTNDTESPKTLDALRSAGVSIAIGTDDANEKLIPSDVDLIVYSDAWPKMAPHFMERVKALGKPMQSYFEALGEAAQGYRVVAVSGTHGKTTTTGMIGKILSDAGVSPTVIVGSIVADFGSNFVPGDSDIFVVEADEYMKHFLNFNPEVLVINNIEHDHTDFYPTLADMQEAFGELARRVPSNGAIVTTMQGKNIALVLQSISAPVTDYAAISVPELKLIGEFNKNNARAAKTAALAIAPHIPEADIDASLAAFKGSWRRFEYKGVTNEGALVYDDYAHHPTAVLETLRGVKERFPDKRITAVFQPHLYSRTRDLLDEFAHAFSDAANVFSAPIFAAREQPIPGITNEVVAEKIRMVRGEAVALSSFEEIESLVHKACGEKDLIITMGAGNIYTVAESLTK